MTELADTSAWVWSRRSGHRELRHALELLIAAAAEAAGLTVLHYDEDFDRIAEITGQPTRWLAERGAL